MIVDAHAYVLPDPYGILARSEPLRSKVKTWVAPAVRTLHHTQKWLRFLPEPVRRNLDPVGAALLALPALAIESSLGDLKRMLDAQNVQNTLVSAHAGLASNSFVLECAAQDPRIWAAVHLGPEVSEAASRLREYRARGARALKLHPAASGHGPEDPAYTELLTTAGELGMPVFLHTGSMYWPMFKNPSLGRAELYRDWYRDHPSVRFVLAHMNYQEPSVAMDLAEEFPNLHLETSWQPMETIAEAVRRIGAGRVIFGSGWPFLGENVAVGLQLIRECVAADLCTEKDSERILGLNAFELLSLPGGTS